MSNLDHSHLKRFGYNARRMKEEKPSHEPYLRGSHGCEKLVTSINQSINRSIIYCCNTSNLYNKIIMNITGYYFWESRNLLMIKSIKNNCIRNISQQKNISQLLCLTVLVLGALLSSFLEEAPYKCSIWMNEWKKENIQLDLIQHGKPKEMNWTPLCYMILIRYFDMARSYERSSK